VLERIAFILDDTAERFDALLNPETVRLRRQSGLRSLTDRPGTITGAAGSDDLIVATAGGRTEIELDLLFDVELLGAPGRGGSTRRTVRDVRTLTGPLWSLSENRSPAGPARCRLVWGKHLDVPVVVEAVSERLERFDPSGVPTRSYLSLRLVRTATIPASSHHGPPSPAPPPISTAQATPRAPLAGQPASMFHEVVGRSSGAGEAPSRVRGERIDDLATRYYGNPAYWRHLASVNDLDDLPWVPSGRVLVVPPIDLLSAPVVEEARPPGPIGPPATGSSPAGPAADLVDGLPERA
jgi:hypothetical protein